MDGTGARESLITCAESTRDRLAPPTQRWATVVSGVPPAVAPAGGGAQVSNPLKWWGWAGRRPHGGRPPAREDPILAWYPPFKEEFKGKLGKLSNLNDSLKK